MRVAVLGMGKMGHAVAGRLLAGGHEVRVWNRSPGKADDLIAEGAEEAESAEAAIAGVEAVITSLSEDSAVLAVAGGDGGIATKLAEGTIYLDMSTVAPETAAALSEATGTGSFLASPILGAPQAVESGRATYLVAGPKEAFERVRPLYRSLSEQVRYLGEEVGRALELKLLANYLLLAGIATLAEFVSAAQAVGLEDAFALQFLESSPLVADGLSNRLEPLFTGAHSGWFTTALGAKDLRLAAEMAKRHGLVLPLVELVKSRYEEAATTAYGDEDLTAIVELTRKK